MVQASGGGGGHVYPTGLTFFKGCNFTISGTKMYTINTNTKRACVFLREQINGAGQYDTLNVSGWVDPAYGIPIPSGCTKVTVDCPNLQTRINAHKDINGSVYAVDAGNWSSTGGSINYDLSTFIASGATHLSIGFRNSTDTDLMSMTIDSSTVDIYFD